MSLVLAGVAGPVDSVAVDPDQGAVEHHEGCARPIGVAQGVADARGQGGEQSDGLAGTSPRGGGPDAEAGREIAQCLALAQVGEREQGLGAGIEGAPVRADGLAVGPDEAGYSVEGRGGQRQCGRVEQHEGSWEAEISIRPSSLPTRRDCQRGAAMLS